MCQKVVVATIFPFRKSKKSENFNENCKTLKISEAFRMISEKWQIVNKTLKRIDKKLKFLALVNLSHEKLRNKIKNHQKLS